GLLFGLLAKQHREEFLPAAEGIGDIMALITWVIYGAAVISQAIGNFSWVIHKSPYRTEINNFVIILVGGFQGAKFWVDGKR
ncbi:MAG: hypothetical protein GY850_01555, partial [bacterium]|nr:hypothetical protein [bacterium]